MTLTNNPEDHTCSRCGYNYDPSEQEFPDGGTIYWEPSCPECNAKVTANEVDQTYVNITSNHLASDIKRGRFPISEDEKDHRATKEERLYELQLMARKLHDRMLW